MPLHPARWGLCLGIAAALVAAGGPWLAPDAAARAAQTINEVRERCFPGGQAASAARPRSLRATALPSQAGPVLAVTTSGQVWVLRNGAATVWGTTSTSAAGRYLWARWMADGTILASRVRVGTTAGTVHFDRLSGPGRRTEVATLPFTVKADAPAGYCPVDGPLATFAVVPSGVVLLAHRAGPLLHSCPHAVADDPWRCAKAEGFILELRTAALAPSSSLHQAVNMFVMATPFVVADAARADTFVVRFGDTAMRYFTEKSGWNQRFVPVDVALTADGQPVVVDASVTAAVSTPAGLVTAFGRDPAAAHLGTDDAGGPPAGRGRVPRRPPLTRSSGHGRLDADRLRWAASAPTQEER